MAASANHAPHVERGGSAAPFVGISLITLACFCFAVLNAIAKYLGQSLPTFQIVWVRFVTHVIFALILFRVWRTPGVPLTRRPLLQLARSFCLLGTTLCNFLAVQHLQLAETMSIFFGAPFVVTALAGPMLGEWAGRRRWAAILVGFSGVLVVTQPGFGTMHWAVIYSVGAMILYAVYSLLTRQLTATESTVGLVIISGLTAAVAMTPVGLTE